MSSAREVGPMIPLRQARHRLSLIWFAGSGMIFLLLLGTSMGNVFAGRIQEVWSASLPTIVPTLALIVSVLGANALIKKPPGDPKANSEKAEETSGEIYVRRDFYRLTCGLSTGYLILVLFSFFAHPFMTAANAPDVTSEQFLEELEASAAAPRHTTAADVILLSNLWLTPVQGLVVASMGVLFFTRSD